MENPYLALHREFREAGAELLISSGQACVVFGIAAFSKDGDWIIRETEASCGAALDVLSAKRAVYRLGTPLHPGWLARGLTSHFEFLAPDGYRARVDFCSRPPRVPDVSRLWDRAIHEGGVDVVDVRALRDKLVLVQAEAAMALGSLGMRGAAGPLRSVLGRKGLAPPLRIASRCCFPGPL